MAPRPKPEQVRWNHSDRFVSTLETRDMIHEEGKKAKLGPWKLVATVAHLHNGMWAVYLGDRRPETQKKLEQEYLTKEAAIRAALEAAPKVIT